MATVRVTHEATVNGRRITLKAAASPVVAGSTAPAAQYFKAVVTASATQLRVMAEEGRDIVVGRLYAARAQPPGVTTLAAPTMLRRQDIPTVARQPRNYRFLTREHVARKLRLGLDGRYLIASGDYLAGIEVFKGKAPDGGPYYMVRLRKRLHVVTPGLGGTPVTLTMLARVHEFGSRKWRVPARPHWRPALKDIADRFKRLRKTIKAEALRASLRRIA